MDDLTPPAAAFAKPKPKPVSVSEQPIPKLDNIEPSSPFMTHSDLLKNTPSPKTPVVGTGFSSAVNSEPDHEQQEGEVAANNNRHVRNISSISSAGLSAGSEFVTTGSALDEVNELVPHSSSEDSGKDAYISVTSSSGDSETFQSPTKVALPRLFSTENNDEDLQVEEEATIQKEQDGHEPTEHEITAQKLYDGVYEKLREDEYARWLGSEGAEPDAVRKAYMGLFEWKSLSILMALRSLCNRLYMKGESQQLNRVIESFSQAWEESNPNHGFYDSTVVYTITYALILLNTDIYAADHTVSKKMTKSTFVNNTLETIRSHAKTEKQALKAAKTLEAGDAKTSLEENYDNHHKPTKTSKRASMTNFTNSSHNQVQDTTALVNDSSVKPLTKEWEFQIESALKVFYTSVSKEALKLHIVEAPSSTPSSNIYGHQASSMTSNTPSMRSSSILGGGGAGGGGGGGGGGASSIFGRMSLNKFRNNNRNSENQNQSRLSSLAGLDRSGDSFRRDSLNSAFSGESNFSAAFGNNRHAVGFAGLLWSSMVKEEESATAEVEEEEDSFGDFAKIEKELEKEVELELLGPPWTKEGLLKYRPYIDPNNGRKSKKKDWSQIFMVVQRGQLKMFNFDTSSSSSHHNKSSGPVNGVVGAGNWMENANIVDGFHLCHTMAQELPPPKKAKGYEALWSLTLPQRGLLVFQAGTQEIAQEFVYTCNYWAARLSKEPFEEPVSSMEFGWGVPLQENVSTTTGDEQPTTNATSAGNKPITTHNAKSSSRGGPRNPTPGDKTVIKEWKPTGHSLVVSELDEEKQLANLKAYITRAEEELTEHNSLRARISQSFTPGSPNWSKAHSNWEKKSQYLLQQVIRFKTYVEGLEKGIKEKKEKLPAEEEEEEEEEEEIEEEEQGKKQEPATEHTKFNNANLDSDADSDSSASVVTATYGESSSGNESSKPTLESSLEVDEKSKTFPKEEKVNYQSRFMKNSE